MALFPDETIDLDAYFQRIGDRGDHSPTLKALQEIHWHHVTTIAFENLTPLLKQPVPLDLASLQQKLILSGRGGYCFEQNLLLRSVLLQLGFQVKTLAARVLWGVPKGVVTPRSHMLLLVKISGQDYIADVGFGGLTLTAPVAFITDVEQKTPHETFRLQFEDPFYVLQAKLGQEWRSLYRFDLQEQYFPDYDVSNWYVSTHPNSRFVNSLIVARPDVDCRYALLNNQLITHRLDGHSERRFLVSVVALRDVLQEKFKLELPAIAELDATLQFLIDQK